MTDTHADEKPNKKKKPHRGYAFVVFEREKDMRGKATTDLVPRVPFVLAARWATLLPHHVPH